MKVAVVIPWRSQPSRIKAFEKICAFFEKHHPDFNLIISDSETNVFNVSKARNLGAKKAIDLGSDIIIFNDADFFAEPESIKNGLKIAFEMQEAVLAYDTYCQHNTKKETEMFFKKMNYKNILGFFGTPPKMLNNGLPDKLYPCSGCLIMPTKIFQELGGYEEKIVGWGPEDQLLHRVYFDKYNKVFTHVPGVAHSTYNEPGVRKNLYENHKEFFDLIWFKDKE
jgi:predicted glycosyltransferase involved in capsule biosynthesis